MSRIKLSFDGDFLSNLPEEILLQILNKLPAEALIQLISVSKQFKSLIQNPQFIEAHLLSSVEISSKQYLISFSFGFSSYRVLVSSPPNYSSLNSIHVPFQLYSSQRRPRVIGNSARGVVCLVSEDTHNLILWNPSTRKFRMVPYTSSTYYNYYTVYGFGFDHVNIDFKIVLLSYNHRKKEIDHVQVYEAKSGRWKSVATKVHCHVTGNCVHVNGTVYWPAMKISGDVHAPCILGFDVVNEVFKVVELPPSQNPPILGIKIFLTSSSDGKSLAFSGICDPGCFRRWSVWYLSSSKDSIWEKRYEISGADSFRPLCILDDDSGAVFVQFHASDATATGVVNGVKRGAACSAAKEVNHISLADFSSEFGFTSYTYTPSLAFLLE